MKVSISLGGSLLTRTGDSKPFRDYAEALRVLRDCGHTLVVVCGGGRPARQYIAMGKELGATRDEQDRLGIIATHLNALLLISALGDAADPRIHRRSSEVKAHLDDKILVGGGHAPGSSTDYRAALFAGAIGADLIINATDVDGVYDKNPKTHPDAVKQPRLTYRGLERIVEANTRQAPGEYGLFDLKAVRYAAGKRIPIAIIDGTDPAEIWRAVDGKARGTLIAD
jgi:uridylate kinase